MKTIGVLGGMSWESSLEWYRLANQRVRQRRGGHHSARIVLDSVDFAEIEAIQARDDWHAAGTLLADRARALESAGAELLVLCTNTMHLVADRIEDAVGIPFLHIGDVAAQSVAEAGVQTVGLLGTAFTMEQSFYRDRLTSHGIRSIVPEAVDRAVVHSIIYDELVHGQIIEASRRQMVEIIVRLIDRGAEGVILGCTELELLVGAEDSPAPVFPTTALYVEVAVDRALADD
jgi:aspartate racemase